MKSLIIDLLILSPLIILIILGIFGFPLFFYLLFIIPLVIILFGVVLVRHHYIDSKKGKPESKIVKTLSRVVFYALLIIFILICCYLIGSLHSIY